VEVNGHRPLAPADTESVIAHRFWYETLATQMTGLDHMVPDARITKAGDILKVEDHYGHVGDGAFRHDGLRNPEPPGSVLSVLGRARIVPVAVAVSDFSVSTVDYDIGVFLLRDRDRCFDRGTLRWLDDGGLLIASADNRPSTRTFRDMLVFTHTTRR
jgi:hypothetical protein